MKTNVKMKTGKILAMASLGLMATVNVGCDKDNPLNPLNGNGECLEESQIELIENKTEAVVAAQTAYNKNPTAENCKKWNTEIVAYTELMLSYADCSTAAVKADWEEELKIAKKNAEENNCN